MRWFRRYGPLFAPVSVLGWLLSGLFLAFCVNIFVWADANSHSVSDTFYRVFPYWAPTFLLWAWIAERTSRA